MSTSFNLAGRTAVLTGATGGIGAALARMLAAHRVRLILSGRNREQLEKLRHALPEECVQALVIGSLIDGSTRTELAAAARTAGATILINAAGINQLCLFADQADTALHQLVETNLEAPMQLTRALLPDLAEAEAALIVNVGSVFGTIGHPGYAAYCATKFGLRGFSEALSRELSDGPVRVLHVEPRATRTAMNDGQARALNEALGNAEDPPEAVAAAVLAAMQHGTARTTLGWPEKFFSALNRTLPSIVDNALKGKLELIRSTLARHPL